MVNACRQAGAHDMYLVKLDSVGTLGKYNHVVVADQSQMEFVVMDLAVALMVIQKKVVPDGKHPRL